MTREELKVCFKKSFDKLDTGDGIASGASYDLVVRIIDSYNEEYLTSALEEISMAARNILLLSQGALIGLVKDTNG